MTFAAGYIVPLALAATAADATVRHSSMRSRFAATLPHVLGPVPDDGARWFFSGLGTYRMIKRHAAAMRAAMAPEESAALLDDGEWRKPALAVGLQPGSSKRAMRAWAEEKDTSPFFDTRHGPPICFCTRKGCTASHELAGPLEARS